MNLNFRKKGKQPEQFKYELGSTVKDQITNFEGVVVARTQYMTGCNRYAVQPRALDRDGKPIDWHNFDENQLVQVTDKELKIKEAKVKGGPAPSVRNDYSMQR